jgi:hypothetical protein
MSKLVVDGAQLKCSEGIAPAGLTVLPTVGSEADQMAAATIADSVPMVNIAPFGMCRSLANPRVAAATSAAMGTLTPQPCVPATAGPWSPGSSIVTLNGVSALTADSKCACTWAGTIEVVDPGATVEATG